MEEHELIRQVKAGNREAQREFINRYKDNVYRTCMGFVHSQADADDLTQEVFIKALQSIEQFRHDARVSTWLYRIATNMALNFLRSQKRKQFFKRISNWFGRENEEQDFPEPAADDRAAPEYEMEQTERQKALQQALDKLPEKQRKAFVLHKYEELSYAQIAATLDTSLSSVESLMHRARINLQKSLSTFYEKNYQ